MDYDKAQLQQLIRELALQFGDFTLASGKQAKYYLDCRKLTLDSRGACMVAAGMLEMLGDDLPDAVGGMAIGADPITGALITTAGLAGKRLSGFIVRKEAKQHGTGRTVEGPVEPGQRVVVVEDVITTGGSALKAVEHCREFGLQVTEVLAIVDRLAGGAEAFANVGCKLRTLTTVAELGVKE